MEAWEEEVDSLEDVVAVEDSADEVVESVAKINVKERRKKKSSGGGRGWPCVVYFWGVRGGHSKGALWGGGGRVGILDIRFSSTEVTAGVISFSLKNWVVLEDELFIMLVIV